MSINCVLSEYIEGALDRAEFEKLEDGSYSGSIPICPGVIAFAGSLRGCERELRSVFEDWLLVGLKLGHLLPVIGEIDLNQDMAHAEMEPVEASGFHSTPTPTRIRGSVLGSQASIYDNRAESTDATVER